MTDAELEFWRSIQNSSVAAEFEVYLQQFPQGTYAGLARVRLQMLGESSAIPRRDDATVAIAEPRAAAKRLPALAGIAVLLVAAGVGAYLAFGPAPAPKAPEAAKLEVPAAEVEKIRKDAEERVRREYADKSAAEQAAAAKAAIEKATQEKLLVMKAAAEKAAADKAAADKVAAEKAAIEKAIAAAKLAGDKAALEKAGAEKAALEKVLAEKAAAEKAAAEKAAAERAAVEKAAAEKDAADRAAAEKVAAEKAAAAKAAAAKPGWPSVGERWVYDVRELAGPASRIQVAVEVQAVTASSVREVASQTGGDPIVSTYTGGVSLKGIAPGFASFSPYLRAFQELRAGERWSPVALDSLWECSTNTDWHCTAAARVVGRETVSVRAGSFEATRIEVELNARRPVHSGSPLKAFGVTVITYWFADGARRYVKAQTRGKGGDAAFPDSEVELISHSAATR